MKRQKSISSSSSTLPSSPSKKAKSSSSQQRTISSFFAPVSKKQDTPSSSSSNPSSITSPVCTTSTPSATPSSSTALSASTLTAKTTPAVAVVRSPLTLAQPSSLPKKAPLTVQEEECMDTEMDLDLELKEQSQSTTKPAKTTSKLADASKYRFTKTRSELLAANSQPQQSSTTTPTEESSTQPSARALAIRKKLASTSFDRYSNVREQTDSQDNQEDPSSSQSTATKKSATSSSTKKSAVKYTPLEQQFMEIKSQNPSCLLVVEVGYKFRFFGEDAKIAGQALGIVAYLDHNFYTASIPTHRLGVHVKKLVNLGHKVGVVRQIETAAIKASGDNRNAPFVRKLTNVYTKGTFIDDLITDGTGSEEDHSDLQSSYLVSIFEEGVDVKGGSSDGASVSKPTISMVAVMLSTGDIVYDSFQDNLLRSELETRLLHLEPSEMVLPINKLSSPSEKVIQHIMTRISTRTSGGGNMDTMRIEKSAKLFTDYNTSLQFLTSFYENKSSGGQLLDQTLQLPQGVVVALAGLIGYLKEFKLESALQNLSLFTPFASRSHMLLNANTVASLEIFRNLTDFSEHGSLFSIMDRTITRFGKRLFRKWVSQPLVQVKALNERMAAVQELLDKNGDILLHRAKSLLQQLPDIEKLITKIYYGKCSPAELFTTLIVFEKISTSFPVDSIAFTSSILVDIFTSLSASQSDIQFFKQSLYESAARQNDKISLFVNAEERWPEIGTFKQGIVDVDAELDGHLVEVKKVLKLSSLAYSSVSGVDYLIELKNNNLKSVPKDWVKISTTKAVSRFHSPFILEKVKERDVFKEKLTIACDAAFKEFVADIAGKYEHLRDMVTKLAALDCLHSLATLAQTPGYTKPTFTTDTNTPPFINVTNARNPITETLLPSYVPNDIQLNSATNRCLIITGPNMGGKSSFTRQVALLTIMAQIGSYVPADSAEMGLFDAVFTRMGASDDIGRGQSTFMKELSETSEILKDATQRSLVILDELGRGTSTHDGVAIAYATLQHFITNVKCVILFVTHYPSLGKLEEEFPENVSNGHMGFMETGDSDIVFLYKLTPGLAHRSYGLNVARLAHLPEEVISIAGVKSAEFERAMKVKSLIKRIMVLKKWIENEDVSTSDAQELVRLG